MPQREVIAASLDVADQVLRLNLDGPGGDFVSLPLGQVVDLVVADAERARAEAQHEHEHEQEAA